MLSHLSRSDDVVKKLDECKVIADNKAKAAAAAAVKKGDAAALERPLRTALVQLQFYATVDKSPNVKILDAFAERNAGAHWPVRYPKSAAKPAKVAAIVACLNVVQRRQRADGTSAPVTCTNCSHSSTHDGCVACACGEWLCHECAPNVGEQHRRTCARGGEAIGEFCSQLDTVLTVFAVFPVTSSQSQSTSGSREFFDNSINCVYLISL